MEALALRRDRVDVGGGEVAQRHAEGEAPVDRAWVGRPDRLSGDGDGEHGHQGECCGDRGPPHDVSPSHVGERTSRAPISPQHLRHMNPRRRRCAYGTARPGLYTRHHSSTRHTSSRSRNGTHRDPNPTSTYPVTDGSRNARTIWARLLSMRNRLSGIVLTQSFSRAPRARTPVPGPTSTVATTSFRFGSISETVLSPSSRDHMARPSLTIFHAVTSILAMTSIVSGSTRKTPSSQWATHAEIGRAH